MKMYIALAVAVLLLIITCKRMPVFQPMPIYHPVFKMDTIHIKDVGVKTYAFKALLVETNEIVYIYLKSNMAHKWKTGDFALVNMLTMEIDYVDKYAMVCMILEELKFNHI